MTRYFITRYGEIIAGPFKTRHDAVRAEREINERGTITRLAWNRVAA